MNNRKLVNIARLMTTYNFEIEQLPDNLKCVQCRLMLKDACQLPCCCRYCRVCIKDLMTRGSEFCSGVSGECGESLLSRHQLDYMANRKVSRLVVKCPHDGCVHKCQFVNIEEHLRECHRNSEECPFRELGCTQDKLTAEEMGGHLLNENRRHSEILIGMIDNINREIDMLKRRDEASSKEIETLKHELVLKDEQIRSIMDQMIHLRNKNKLMKNDIKLIKEEKEDLAGRVTILMEKIEQEMEERRENNELDSAKVIDHVDREIAAVTLLIGSNKSELVNEMQSLRGNIGSRNQDVQSIKEDICSVKSKVQSVQMHRIDLAQKELKRMLREIGETVTLTCRVEDVSELSVTFRHGTNKAENGISHFAAYVTSKVPVNKHILHLLKITKLQWDDHGLWECMQGGTAWNATIDITVQSSIEPLRASLAPLAAASSDQLRSGAVAIGNEDGEVTPHLLYGKGIRTNPFNLTGGARITLECVTGCSFPATRHRSVFSNHSTAPEVIIDASSTTVIGSCSVPNEVSGMVTRSSVLLSCASFPSLVGSNEVSCSMVEDSSCRRPDCVAATRHIPVTFPSVLLLPRSMQCSLS